MFMDLFYFFTLNFALYCLDIMPSMRFTHQVELLVVLKSERQATSVTERPSRFCADTCPSLHRQKIKEGLRDLGCSPNVMYRKAYLVH